MERFIGIDLGTTYSAVSTIDEYGKPVIVRNREGEHLTPSVVYFPPGGNPVAGAEAKEMMLSGEDNVIMFFKREMGNPEFRFSVHGKEYSATDLSAILLCKLRDDAEAALGGSVTKSVITVPAYFNDLQRNETIKAAQIAGLEVMRIINEPTAAAINYGIARQGDGRLLVYDLGGGTFDVTVLEVSGGDITVLSTGGDHNLGGKDWDDCIITYITDQFEKEFGENPNDDPLTYNDLVFNAERLKKQLSVVRSASMTVRYAGHRQKYEITREKFEELTEHLMQGTRQKTKEVLSEAGLGWGDLAGVLLVGGSTKMPMVENWVRQMSGKEPLRGINVDEAVCLGAGIQAALEAERQNRRMGLPGAQGPRLSLPGGRPLNIKDVMSHSLGAIAVSKEGDRYVNSIIIRKNVTIPVTENRPFKLRTRPGGGNEMEVYLTQGEGTEVTQCTVVGRYVLRGIAHTGSGEAIIDIGYAYDENGVINVSGRQQGMAPPLLVEKLPLPDDMSWLYGQPKSNAGLNIMLVIDISYSMEGHPLSQAKKAALEFVKKTNLETSAISVIGFSDDVTEYCQPSHDRGVIEKAIKRLKEQGGTESPLEFCYQRLAGSKAKPVIVVLTDGSWSGQKRAIATSDRCRDVGIDIIAIGFGSADKEFLRRISTISVMTDLDKLVDSFGTIAQELAQSGSASGIKFR